MVSRVLAHPDLPTRDVSSIRAVTLGGSAVAPALMEAVRLAFPNAQRGVSQIYGLSEAGGTLTVATGRDSIDRSGTVGRPLPTVELRISNPNSAGVGDVEARTPMAMNGYWGRDPLDTIDADGWLRTGDIGWLDDDGYLFLTGRGTDLIIRGGENIAGPHVEAALARHPDVVDVAVVGLPDPDLGEVVAAVVRRREGAVVSRSELRSFAAKQLAYFEIPSAWWIIDQPLPTNAAGKVDKRLLRSSWPSADEWAGSHSTASEIKP